MAKSWPYFILLLFSVALLFPVVFTGQDSFFIKQDNLHQAFPWYNKLAISLHKGYLPVWDANTFGGKNFAGEPQTGIFYPVNILWCLIFGSTSGIRTYWLDILVAIHFLFCAFGMYRLARLFQLPVIAAIISSIIFTFSGAVGARAAAQTCIFFGLTWLPWGVYYVAQYCLVQRQLKYVILAGIIGAMQILAGHFQPFFHTILIEGLMLLGFGFRGRNSLLQLGLSAGVLIIIIGIAFLASVPQLYYLFQYMSRSYRAVSHGLYIGPGQSVPYFIYSHWFILNPANFLNLFGRGYFQPDDDNILYMGVLPLVLLALYLLWFRTKNTSSIHGRVTKLMALILGIGVISSMGYRTLFCFVLYHIPFVNLIRQLGRYAILISFSASLLVGLGITYLGEIKSWIFGKGLKLVRSMPFGISLVTVAAGFFFPDSVPSVVWVPFALTFGFLWWLSYGEGSRYWVVLVVGIIFVDLLLNPVGYLSVKTYFYPDRFYGRNRIIDSMESTYGKYRVDLDMSNYALMRRNLGDIYTVQTKNGYGATVNEDFWNFTNRYPNREKEVNDLLNIRYVITDKRLDSGVIYRDSIDYLRLYERTSWYPRYFWKYQLGEPGWQIEKENMDAIHLIGYSDNEVKLRVLSTTLDTLIFSENCYPGWTCWDNGKKIEILGAAIEDYPRLFRSIVVGSGEHVIEFRFVRPFGLF